ncbi:uncharacterized protein LOC117103747 [Anneissia japonica]|uniref:uncharacterized protein LOC117103747 n=1 Tax=Anneissia japonica TaxID=1529436 RepID=UPI0014257801|nr:uncharacterized protein LOC117103747 [Anneissia japonica]
MNLAFQFESEFTAVQVLRCWFCIKLMLIEYLSYKKTAVVRQGTDLRVTDGLDHTPSDQCFPPDDDQAVFWIKVKLGAEYSVTSVTAINHVGADTLNGTVDAEIRIGNNINYMRTESMCGNPVSQSDVSSSAILDFKCVPALKGKYVMIWLPSGEKKLHICEIRVYGYLEAEDRQVSANLCYSSKHLQLTSGIVSKINRVYTEEMYIRVQEMIMPKIPINGQLTFEHSMTIAFDIYPYPDSNGPIIVLGDTSAKFEIIQMKSEVGLSNSEVSVSYAGSVITSANILLPETWTFLAVTFDVSIQTLSLWRDGEIASMSTTNFYNFGFSFDQFEFGNNAANFDGVHANVSWLQVYDRVLDEFEMKEVQNKDVSKCQSLFQTAKKHETFESEPTGVRYQTKSIIECALTCRHSSQCYSFQYNFGSKICEHQAYENQYSTLGHGNDVYYSWITYVH